MNVWADATKEQGARMEADPWEDMIATFLDRIIESGRLWIEGRIMLCADARGEPEYRVSTEFLLDDVLFINPAQRNNNQTKRLADVMAGLGWTRPDTVIRFGKEVKRGFVKSAADDYETDYELLKEYKAAQEKQQSDNKEQSNDEKQSNDGEETNAE
jgi:hypothetical protein